MFDFHHNPSPSLIVLLLQVSYMQHIYQFVS